MRDRKAVNVVQGERHGGEAALAEEVHLDEAEGFDGVHVVLRDDDALGGAFERDKLRERARGDDRAARMNAEMARGVVEAQSDLENSFPGLVVDGQAAALREIADSLQNFAHGAMRKAFGEAVHFAGRNAEDFGNFADGEASVHGDETSDHCYAGPFLGPSCMSSLRRLRPMCLLPRLCYLRPLPWRSHASSSLKLRHRLFAPFGVHVVEKLVAAGAADVDVDIGTIAALLVEKTLEIKAPAERADAGNAKAIGDHGTGGGAAGDGGNAAAAGFLDDVPDKQEIWSEIEFFDDFEFMGEARENFRTQRAIETAGAFKAKLPEIGERRFAFGDGEFGEDEFVQFEPEIAAIGDFESVAKQFGVIGKEALHFRGGLEPGFGGGDFWRLHGSEKAAGADSVNGTMVEMFFGLEEVDGVGGDEWNVEFAAKAVGFAEEAAVARGEMLDGEVEAVGEGGFELGNKRRSRQRIVGCRDPSAASPY